MTMLNNTLPEGEEAREPELRQVAMPAAEEAPAETMHVQSEEAPVEPGNAASSVLGDEATDPEAQQRYWHSVLTGNAETVPMDVRERSGANDVSLSPEQREYNLCSSIYLLWNCERAKYEMKK